MNRMRLAIVALGLGAFVLVLGITAGWTVGRLFAPSAGPRPVNTAAILTQVQGLSQWVTVKYVLEKVVVMEDVKLYGENRVLLVAHGVVKAGVDLDRLQPEDLSVNKRKVVVRLPPATLTDAYLDEEQTQVLEHSTGLLRRFDKDLQQAARREGLDSIRRAARASGILDDARTRAQQMLTHLFRQMGYEEIEFVP